MRAKKSIPGYMKQRNIIRNLEEEEEEGPKYEKPTTKGTTFYQQNKPRAVKVQENSQAYVDLT